MGLSEENILLSKYKPCLELQWGHSKEDNTFFKQRHTDTQTNC